MEFLSGHGAYIAAAYGLSALVLGALTGWIIAERRKLRRTLSALEASPALAGFDLDGWVIDVLSAEEETYLPNAQAFWFFVHEHYFARPDFVARLIAMGRAWVALMCATEARQAVDGMQPVLERLAAERDPEIARVARDHLDRFYRSEAPAGA